MAKRPKQEWPKMMYGPNEQQRVFKQEDKIPSGWKDHPSKVKGAEKPDPGAGRGRTKQTDPNASKDKIDRTGSKAEEVDAAENARFRAEAFAFLETMNVSMPADATDEELEEALDKIEGEGAADDEDSKEGE